MFAGVEGTGTIVVQEVLLEFLSVGFCGWVWQGGRDWWWLCPFGAMAFLLWCGAAAELMELWDWFLRFRSQ